MYYIDKFEKVEETRLATFLKSGSQDATIPNDDAYRKPIPKSTCIDVIRDFSWFAGGASSALTQAAIAKIPNLFMVEKEQILNSQLSQALYYFKAAQRGIDSARDVTSQMKQWLLGDGEETGALAQIAASGLDGIDAGLSLVDRGADFLSQNFAGSSNAENNRLTQNYLRSLIGLYLTKDTGFKYCLPYFENPPTITNNWGNADNQGLIRGAINTGMDMVNEVAQAVNLSQPGVYIQEAKYYNFNDEGPSLTVTIPLFNTVKRGSKVPYIQNYEFLWLLTYQNKPYKTSFARTMPPKMYDVTLPGLVNMPYAYIKSLRVDFKGTVRNKSFYINGLGNITAPIPDAYEVTIELQSLILDYANLMVGEGFGVRIVDNEVSVGRHDPDGPKPGDGDTVATFGSNNDPADNGAGQFTGREAIEQAQNLGINPRGNDGTGPTAITELTLPDVGPIGVRRERILGPGTSTTSGETPPVNNQGQSIIPGGESNGSLLNSIVNPAGNIPFGSGDTFNSDLSLEAQEVINNSTFGGPGT